MSQPLHSHGLACEIVGSKHFPDGSLKSAKDAERSHRTWIPGTAVRLGDACHIPRFLMDQIHVGHRGADILSRDVTTVEPLDITPQGAKQRLTLICFWVAYHNGLAAAQVQSGRRRLVSHPAGQPQRVGNRSLLRGVRPHATSAERRTECRIMNRDHRFESRRLVLTENDLFVVVPRQRFENLQIRRLPRLVYPAIPHALTSQSKFLANPSWCSQNRPFDHTAATRHEIYCAHAQFVACNYLRGLRCATAVRYEYSGLAKSMERQSELLQLIV